MRLLKREPDGFSLVAFFGTDPPPYAILSHTWGANEDEVTFKDFSEGTKESKPGYDKIRFCAEQSRRDGLQYFWIDTCCINKSDSSEHQEAINCMYRWYRNAD